MGIQTFVLDKPTTARDSFISADRRLVDQGQPSQALQAVLCVFLFHFFFSTLREREKRDGLDPICFGWVDKLEVEFENILIRLGYWSLYTSRSTFSI